MEGTTEGKQDVQHSKQKVPLNSAAPSASSSPSHEFSFTISLHPPTTAAKSSPPPYSAIDLSPADEIFFHGHLLPLHLLSHLPVSPRSSTNSMDSFTLPIKELLQNDDVCTTDENNHTNNKHNNIDDDNDNRRGRRHEISPVWEGKGRGKSKSKSKSFSLSFPKWRKNYHDQEKEDDDYQRQKRSKSSKLDLLKRYVSFVKPFLSLRNYKRGNSGEIFRQKPYSYSGNIRLRPNKEMRGRRGEFFSAPASMITSPTNSGLLVASGSVTPTKASDSTMEELQAAIQAAIAHCKKSIATEDNVKAP